MTNTILSNSSHIEYTNNMLSILPYSKRQKTLSVFLLDLYYLRLVLYHQVTQFLLHKNL